MILISNDDGVEAPGLEALGRSMARVGETLICAPATEQSAKAHSISVNQDLRLAEHPRDGAVWAYSLDGTPADCVKFAILRLLGGRKPDLVIAGINRGRNTGVNVIYSGTVAAAIEGAIYGIPAIAVSVEVPRDGGAIDFAPAATYAERLARCVLREGLPPNVILNMNVPHVPLAQIRGVVISRMSRSMYTDKFDKEDLHGGIAVYRNVGDRMVFDRANDDNDDLALEQNKVSITPLHFDLTHHHFREELEKWVQGLHAPDLTQNLEALSRDLAAEIRDSDG